MVFEENINCVLAVESGYAVFFLFWLVEKNIGDFLHGIFWSASLLYNNNVDKKDKEEDLAPDDVKKCHLIERRVNSK